MKLADLTATWVSRSIHNDLAGWDFTFAGFDVTVRFEYDEWVHLNDWQPQLTQKFEARCVPNPRYRREMHKRGRSNEAPWIRLSTSEKEHRDGLEKMKFGRTQAAELARKYVQADVESALGDELRAYVCDVTVSRRGDRLGEFGCGFTMSERDDSYLREIAWDCVTEALDAAKLGIEEARERADRLASYEKDLEVARATWRSA